MLNNRQWRHVARTSGFLLTVNMADEATRKVVSEIPLLKTNSGPRDKELWVQRLREEYLALIKVSIIFINYKNKHRASKPYEWIKIRVIT